MRERAIATGPQSSRLTMFTKDGMVPPGNSMLEVQMMANSPLKNAIRQCSYMRRNSTSRCCHPTCARRAISFRLPCRINVAHKPTVK